MRVEFRACDASKIVMSSFETLSQCICSKYETPISTRTAHSSRITCLEAVVVFVAPAEFVVPSVESVCEVLKVFVLASAKILMLRVLGDIFLSKSDVRSHLRSLH